MKGVHLHEVSDDRIIVEMRGTAKELVAVFDRLIANGVTLYHPKNVEDRNTVQMMEYPEDKLEEVNLKARRKEVKRFVDSAWGNNITMAYVTKTADDAVSVKLSV